MPEYVLNDFHFSALSNRFILQHSAERVADDIRGFYDIHPQSIGINYAVFTGLAGIMAPELVEVKYLQHTLILYCGCNEPNTKLCTHQVQVLMNILKRKEIRIFFDTDFRHEKLKQTALDYGLENERNPDDFFQVNYVNKLIEIKPLLKGLLSFNQKNSSSLEEYLSPKQTVPAVQKENAGMVLIIGKHRYYDLLNIELYEAETTRNSKLKNPLQKINPFELAWHTQDNDTLKFYTAVSRFQSSASEKQRQICPG